VASASIFKSRIANVQAALDCSNLEGIVVIKPENVRYLSGVWGYSTRPEYAMPRRLVALVLPRQGEPTLIVPKIEFLFARRRTWISDVRHHVEWTSADGIFGGGALLNVVLREKGLLGQRLGLELGFVSAKLHRYLVDEFSTTTFVDASDVIPDIRMIKSSDEIRIMRLGAKMAVSEFEAEVRCIRSGMREYEVAMCGRDEATRQIARLTDVGDPDVPLEHPLNDGIQIVTSGPRLDMPHALASMREIQQSDIVLLDFCRVPQLDYYRIGFARNVALRPLTKEEAGMFSICADAYRRAVEILKPGLPAEAPDLVAREVLDKAGFGEAFVHRTGRGVGLEGVERPEIGAGDKTPLQPGMVITIEPSIYLPGFAAHVEDTFLITESGAECLTECPREVQIIQNANR
jgi:Xaa-Pro aminopeptidase